MDLRVGAGTHEILLKRMRPAWPDPAALLYPAFHSACQGLGGNFAWMNDPLSDEAIESIQAEADASRRKLLIQRLGTRFEEEAYLIFVGSSSPLLLRSAKLSSIKLSAYDFDASLQGQDFALLHVRAASE
jgi:ABC-type transport system substrate-binding protein